MASIPTPHTTQAPFRIERTDSVLQLTMNSPANRNSLSTPGLLEGLLDGIGQLEQDDGLKCAVITSAQGVFCSGGDLRRLAASSEADTRAQMTANAELYRRIASSRKMVIAAIDGAAFGAGLGLATCCDLVVAGETARFCCAFVRVGAMPDAGLFWSLPRRVGVSKARQLMLFADEVGGAEALAMGLADHFAEKGSALPAAMALAHQLATGPGRAYTQIKAGLRDASGSMDEALAFQLEQAPPIFASEDFKEGAASFFDKRKPVFRSC